MCGLDPQSIARTAARPCSGRRGPRRGRRWFAALLLTQLTFSATASTVTVFAAASLSESLKEIAADYEKASGNRVVLSFSGSMTLARQIAEGAPAGVFFAADENSMDFLAKQNLVEAGTRRARLANTLVIVVPKTRSISVARAADRAKPSIKRVAIGEPSSVPAGIYARNYLEAQGLWDTVCKKTIPTENVRAALAAVESGNADAAIVYKTDARISRSVVVAVEIPRAEGPRIVYPAALVKTAKNPEAGRSFLDYLDSPAAKAVFRRAGFIVDGLDPGKAAR